MSTQINELPLIASVENILVTALTAHAGGGQALGTPLTHGVNVFSVVASSGDSALLFTPSATGSDEVVVYNNGANAMNVFPATGGQINSLGANVAYSVPVGAQVTFTSISGTQWITSSASSSGTTTLTGDVTGSGGGTIATTLATVNASVGSFTNSSITVNGKGLITAASSGAVLNSTVTFANTAARLVATPAFEGQVGIQIDTTPQAYYTGTSGVGGWERLNIPPYSVASGTNAYAITPAPGFFNAADAYFTGRPYFVQFTNGNTAASTLNVNAFGAVAITKNGSTALVSGDIVATKVYQLVYDGTQFQISDTSIALIAIPVSRTVFVDYVNGTTAAGGALIERADKPFSTKVEAMAFAKASMSPTATNRVLISVAMGSSAEPISFLSATAGVDWDLNGGSINVVAGAISAVDDGGFAIDTIVYNANSLQTSGGTGKGVSTANASSIMKINGNCTSSVSNGAFCSAGIQTINGDVSSSVNLATVCSGGTQTINGNVSYTGATATSVDVCSCITTGVQNITGNISNSDTGTTAYGIQHTSSGTSKYIGNITSGGGGANVTSGIVTLYGNITGGTGTGVATTAGTLNVYGNISTTTGVGAVCSGTGIQNINGNITSATGTVASCSAGTQTIKGNISATVVGSSNIAADCSGGTQTVYGIVTGIFGGAGCTGGTQNINGNISSSGNNAAFCAAGTQNIKGNIAYIGVSATGIDTVECSVTGVQNIVGNISNSDTHATTAYALTYSSSGISSYDGNLTSITSPALNVTLGTVNIGSGSRIVTAGATAATKSGGTLILEGGVSLVSTTNGMTGAGTVLVYGTIVQKFVEAGITYSVGTVITDAAVV